MRSHAKHPTGSAAKARVTIRAARFLNQRSGAWIGLMGCPGRGEKDYIRHEEIAADFGFIDPRLLFFVEHDPRTFEAMAQAKARLGAESNVIFDDLFRFTRGFSFGEVGHLDVDDVSPLTVQMMQDVAGIVSSQGIQSFTLTATMRDTRSSEKQNLDQLGLKFGLVPTLGGHGRWATWTTPGGRYRRRRRIPHVPPDAIAPLAFRRMLPGWTFDVDTYPGANGPTPMITVIGRNRT